MHDLLAAPCPLQEKLVVLSSLFRRTYLTWMEKGLYYYLILFA
jgi:hypothetical protein